MSNTRADILHMAELALSYAQRLGIESANTRVRLEEGQPSAGIPWRLYIVNTGRTIEEKSANEGVHAPGFLTDHGFIGHTKTEAFTTLNTVQWALYTAILGLQSKGIRL